MEIADVIPTTTIIGSIIVLIIAPEICVVDRDVSMGIANVIPVTPMFGSVITLINAPETFIDIENIVISHTTQTHDFHQLLL